MAISLRTKIFLPLLGLMAMLVGYIYGYWMPQSLADMDRQYQEATKRHLESVVEGVIPLLLGRELDTIYENFDALLKKNSDWISILLKDAEGRPLYPLGNTPGPLSAAQAQDLRTLTMQIAYLEMKLGTLTVMVDLSAHLTEWKREFHKAISVMLVVLVSIVLIIGVVLERTVVRPVKALGTAAQNLAEGKFDGQHLKAADDEVGHLVDSFNTMRKNLAASYNLIRQSRDKYSTLYNETPVLLHSEDAGGVIVEVNDFWLKTLGFTRDEVLGRKAADFYAEASRQYAAEVVRPAFLRDGYCKDIPYQFVKKNGELADVLLSATAERDENGNISRCFAVTMDVTDLRKIEKKLLASLREKEVLLQEVHHRVKNNMQVIASLLDLQLGFVQGRPPREFFDDIKNRIKSMALVHERLYLSKDLSKVAFDDYLTVLVQNLCRFYSVDPGKIRLQMDAGGITFGIDTAIPVGLVVNELVTNSLKYAFPGDRTGEVSITLRETGEGDDGRKQYGLTVRDNGIGVPEALDLKDVKTMGLYLVATLVEHQLQGSIDLIRTGGTEFVIRFSELKAKKRA